MDVKIKELLDKRKALKKKKPVFTRQDAHKKKKVGWKWRKPKGSDSKMRVGKKGYKRSVRPGWGSPAVVRGLETNGLKPVYISSPDYLHKVDAGKEAAVITSGVGTRKRLEIVEKAISSGVTVINYKDPKKFVDDTKKQLEAKKKEKEKIKEQRKKKKEEAKKEAEKKAKEEKEKEKKAESKGMTEEEKKEKKLEEKKEKDKLLISTE